jgi:quercetin dioxygenase-like cupin family protein
VVSVKKQSLDALVRNQLEAAASADSGRAAVTVFGGHANTLRQTLIALRAGRELGEHDSPGEATLQVLRGRVKLCAGDDVWNGRPGDLIEIPGRSHSLQAVEDAAVLLTVAKPQPQ